MSKWSLVSVVVMVMAGVCWAIACDGSGAGSSLNACPSPLDIEPGGACVSGIACPSAQSLPDCPGSTGSISCNCTASGWVCVDPYANECFPDAGDEAGDDGGDEGGDEGGDQDGDTDAPDDAEEDVTDAKKG